MNLKPRVAKLFHREREVEREGGRDRERRGERERREREGGREEKERLTFASQSRPMRATRKSTRTIIIPITRMSLILEPVNEHDSHSCSRSNNVVGTLILLIETARYYM